MASRNYAEKKYFYYALLPAVSGQPRPGPHKRQKVWQKQVNTLKGLQRTALEQWTCK